MLLLVSGATRTVDHHDVGHLIVPGAWNKRDKLNLQPGRWAMDNGAFIAFNEGNFIRMVERFADGPGCLFVAAPDVVGDAAATLERWPFWSRLLRGLGLPVAFVAQDGLTVDRVPWRELDALFIGGQTAYKESGAVRGLMAYAKARGIWTHWGRVNGQRRYELALKAGCDSFDGTGFSKWPDTNIPLVKEWDENIAAQPELGL